MDASSRRARPVFADENAVLPSKQASMAASHALQQARALEAPRLPRRAPLQPLAQNVLHKEDSEVWPDEEQQDSAGAETGEPESVEADSAEADSVEAHSISVGDPSRDNLQGVHESTGISDSTGVTVPFQTDFANATGAVLEHIPDDVPLEDGDYSFGASDATIDDAEAEADELDDTQLLAHEHDHIASFADDEADADDETQLRLALMREPVEMSNPHALFPMETAHSRLMLEKCSRVVAATPGVLDAEDEDMWDASMVLEYSDDIFRHLRVMELRLLPKKGYMAHQKELNWTFRTVLVDWLVKIHFRFNLLPETLFLCVNYVDRFLSVREVSLSRLQLVGAVALFVAAKFEEINYLSIQEVSQIVENVYSHDEILKAERYMIDLLDFNLGFPGPMSFLRRVSKADDYELETRTLAKYLLEVTTMDSRFVAAPPSWCAAIAHYMSRHMLRQGPWTPRHVYFSSYTEEQLLPGVRALRGALEDPQKHHQAVFEKYSERKFRKASIFVRNWMELVKERPDVDFVY